MNPPPSRMTPSKSSAAPGICSPDTVVTRVPNSLSQGSNRRNPLPSSLTTTRTSDGTVFADDDITLSFVSAGVRTRLLTLRRADAATILTGRVETRPSAEGSLVSGVMSCGGSSPTGHNGRWSMSHRVGLTGAVGTSDSCLVGRSSSQRHPGLTGAVGTSDSCLVGCPSSRHPVPRHDEARHGFAGAGFVDVGLTGFEPATSSSRTTRATNLRHSPSVALRSPARGVYRRQGEQGRLGSAGDAYGRERRHP